METPIAIKRKVLTEALKKVLESAGKSRKEQLDEAITKALDEEKIPLKHHLKVVEALHKAMVLHKQDREKFNATINQILTKHREHEQKQNLHFEEKNTEFVRQRNEYKQNSSILLREIERVKTLKKGEKGDPGEDGEDAQPVNFEAVISAVLSRITLPEAKEGKPGKDADMEQFVDAVLKRIQKGDVIHINHIRGAGAFIKDGIRYRTEELMHGGGVKQYSVAQGTITGVIDGTNKIFTLPFPSTAWKVYADGAREVSPADYSITGKILTFVMAPTTSVVCDA